MFTSIVYLGLIMLRTHRISSVTRGNCPACLVKSNLKEWNWVVLKLVRYFSFYLTANFILYSFTACISNFKLSHFRSNWMDFAKWLISLLSLQKEMSLWWCFFLFKFFGSSSLQHDFKIWSSFWVILVDFHFENCSFFVCLFVFRFKKEKVFMRNANFLKKVV